jgi:molybdenum cofactor cytidylyltransferase
LIAAIVLAAGRSQRMGRFKPLLPLGTNRTIERTVGLFHHAAIEEIIVVTGHRAGEMRGAVAPLPARCVENPDFPDGMFTSVRAGIQALPEGCHGFFIHPADIPLVRPHTVKRLVAAFREAPPAILYPTFRGERGHPTLIRADLAAGILTWHGAGGLRPFLQMQAAESVDIAVADEAILMDMDTAEDFQRMKNRLASEGIPSENECRALMEDIHPLPPAISAHCRAVATLARHLAEALRAAGIEIDTGLVYTAALLHDIARTEKNHAEAGAKRLEAHGFDRLAPIVRVHMDLEVGAHQPLDEAQVVYLADKATVGDRCMNPEHGFARKMEKFGKDPDAAAGIARRKENARRIRARVEAATGRRLERFIDAARAPASQRD